jgi:hypothetical protein
LLPLGVRLYCVFYLYVTSHFNSLKRPKNGWGAFARKSAENSIISHPALFVNRQNEQKTSPENPIICANFHIDFLKNF